MSDCYNGLQALVHRRINSNVIFVHCYPLALNLVLSDTAAVAIDTVTLFGILKCSMCYLANHIPCYVSIYVCV